MKNILLNELKRILIKERIIYTIIIFLFIGSFIQIKNINIPYPAIYQNHEIYVSDFKKLEGKCSKAKNNYLNNKEKTLLNSNTNMQTAINDYKNNKITIHQLKKILRNQDINLSKLDCFNDVKNYYTYISHKKGLTFTDINGLSALINTDFDLILFLLIVILVISIYLKDQEIQLDLIINTTINKKVCYLSRLLTSIIIVFIFFILEELIRVAYIFFTYGFGDFSSLISSTKIIGYSSWKLSFYQLYIISLFLRQIWIILSFLFCIVLSKFIKKILPFVIINLATVYLPNFIFSKKALSFFPLIGLNQPINYFKGKIYDNNNSIINIPFSKIDYIHILFIIFIFIIICIMILKKHRKFNNRKFFLPLLSFIFVISGCNNNEKIKLHDIYFSNSVNSHFSINNQYIFDVVNSNFTDFTTNKKYNIERNPFFESTILSGHCYQNKYYYLTHEQYQFSIKSLNLNTFESKVIFTNKSAIKDNIFKDILKYTTSIEYIKIEEPISFFCNGKILLLFYSNHVEKVDLNTNIQEKIIKKNIIPSSFQIYNHYLYYLDSLYQLHKYDLNINKDITIKINHLISSFYVINNRIYFIDLKKDHLYIYRKKESKTLINKRILYFYIQKKHCYYVRYDNLLPYDYNLKNKNNKIIMNIENYSFFIKNDKIFFTIYNEKKNDYELVIKEINN